MLSSCCPSNARRRDGGCQARHLVRPGLAEDNCHVTWRNQLRRTGVQVPRLGGRGGAASCPIAWDLPTRELDPRSRRTSLLGATRCHARGRRLGRPRYLLGPSTANLSRSLQRPSMRRRYLSTLSTLVDLCPPSFLPVQSTTFTQQARAGAVFLSCLAVLHAVHLLSVPDLAFAFPPSPALLFSPANAVKLARPEPLSGAPILHRPQNTKRYLHAPTGSNRTAALPHCRTTACGISDRSGDTDTFVPASLSSLPIGEPSRPDLHTRYQIPYRQIWGVAPEFHRARFPRHANQPRVPTGLCLDGVYQLAAAPRPPLFALFRLPIRIPYWRLITSTIGLSPAPWSAGPW